MKATTRTREGRAMISGMHEVLCYPASDALSLCDTDRLPGSLIRKPQVYGAWSTVAFVALLDSAQHVVHMVVAVLLVLTNARIVVETEHGLTLNLIYRNT